MIQKPEIIEHPLFKIIGKCADQMNTNAFVIGGWVRDCVMKRTAKELEFDNQLNIFNLVICS